MNGLVKHVDSTGKNVNVFLGIPFAKPPIGELRFRPPVQLSNANTSKVYDATQLPASCYQSRDTAFAEKYVKTWNPNTNVSEDCLYLNIWEPEGASDNAVLVNLLKLLFLYKNS